MATKNDITGDALISRLPSEAYKNNYDLIFRKEKPQKEKQDGNREENQRGQDDLHQGNS